ncbi:hypothetical protein H6G06_01605 [Anabaena sphaerica FACHB-251]|uniref:HEPN domain-containing protein n=1 Tax=Anabaena sphaerica FACHB-251 TaxID=2692883 RepID=A0A926ZY59_9NOST|nr:hypothetical protein [Anabaena sphaerica]MBD2292207.1 hypothetical protein [Anabaena sphaerica FACHB-251]
MAFYNADNDSTSFSISWVRTPRYHFGVFAQGYRFAANSVAKELIECGDFPDYKAYPVVFLYRHALELHLKNIIYRVAKLLFFKGIERIDNKLYNTHDLNDLSQNAYKVLTSAFPEDETLRKLLIKVVHISEEFSEIDNNSFAYRYPINKEGQYSTKPNQVVNLSSLVSTMDSLLDELEVIDCGLNIETDIAQEAYAILENISN